MFNPALASCQASASWSRLLDATRSSRPRRHLGEVRSELPQARFVPGELIGVRSAKGEPCPPSPELPNFVSDLRRRPTLTIEERSAGQCDVTEPVLVAHAPKSLRLAAECRKSIPC